MHIEGSGQFHVCPSGTIYPDFGGTDSLIGLEITKQARPAGW